MNIFINPSSIFFKMEWNRSLKCSKHYGLFFKFSKELNFLVCDIFKISYFFKDYPFDKLKLSMFWSARKLKVLKGLVNSRFPNRVLKQNWKKAIQIFGSLEDKCGKFRIAQTCFHDLGADKMTLQDLLWSWEMMSNNNNIVTCGKTQQNELHSLWAKYPQN